MQKKTLISFKITVGSLPLVTKGKKIIVGEKLVKKSPEEIDKFDLVKLLNISPKNLHHYLKVKENSHVSVGDTIATKKLLFKKQIIKSPVSGIFVIVDKDKGIVGIKRPQTGEDLISWFEGEVVEIDKEKISINIMGMMIEGKIGQGKPITGKLHLVSGNINVFELPLDIEQKILGLKHASSDMVAKADALGALAIVAESIEEPSFALPYLIVDNLDSLKNYQAKSVVVYGDEKQLFVI